MRHSIRLYLGFMLLGMQAIPAPSEARDIEYRMAVFAMRHGIRHPTPSPDLQLYAQNRQWSSWYTTQAGCLTANGLRVEERLGAYYRDVLMAEGLIPAGGKCPRNSGYYIRADSFVIDVFARRSSNHQ